jgi:lysophospholipase L1-like esterase
MRTPDVILEMRETPDSVVIDNVNVAIRPRIVAVGPPGRDGSTVDASTVAAAGAVMETDTSTADMDFVVDEDTMASDSATKLPTQQSVKAFVDNLLAYSGSDIGLGYRPKNTLYQAWLTKYKAQLANPTITTPLKIFTIGDSITSTTSPTFDNHRPWPMRLAILGCQSEPVGALGGAYGWLYAKPTAGTIGMTSCGGTANQNTTGGWGATLTTSDNATQATFANYLITMWGRTSGGGTIEVRDGSAVGTVLQTISTSGTTKGGMTTQTTLPVNFFGRYIGTLYFVVTGASAVLEGINIRTSSASAVVINGSHSGYTAASFSSEPRRAFDYAEVNQPDVTAILIGVNDGPTNIEANTRALIEGLQAVNPNNLIVLLGCFVTNFSNTFTNAMSLLVKSLADEYDCLFVDVNTTFPQFAGARIFSGDGLHPSQAGHNAIASLVEGVLMGNPLGIAYNTANLAASYKPLVPSYWPYATMPLTDALDYIASRNAQGSASPEGVLAATVGTLFRDTTNGVLYLKVTGTGNTGWVKLSTISSTDTLTNKRVTPRVTTITSSATPTINTDNCDAVTITALATAITSMTTNLTGTPSNFDELIIRIKDDGTARAITWGSKFEAKGVALPTTTVISKVLTVAFIYDTVTAKWGCVGSAQEA